MFRVLLMVALLVGCSQAAPEPHRVSAADRKAYSERAKNLPPDARTYHVGENQLLVVDVPVGGSARHVESQKCFVWRDQEFKSASIQCPPESPGDLTVEGPEVEKNQP
jgi:hypothetical protein